MTETQEEERLEFETLDSRIEDGSVLVTKPVFIQILAADGLFSMTLDEKSVTKFIRQSQDDGKVETRIEFAPLDLVYEPNPE